METLEIETLIIKHRNQFAERWLNYDQVEILYVLYSEDHYSISYIPSRQTQPHVFHITRNEMVRWCDSLKLLEFVVNDVH